MMENIISTLGEEKKNVAVVWRRLGKCLKNYEKCVAKNREQSFGQNGGLPHGENSVRHENVKKKNKKGKN